MFGRLFLFCIYRVAQKSRTQKEIEYLHNGSSKLADFFTTSKRMFTLHIHKDKARVNLFLSVTIDFNQKILIFHRWKKTM